MKKITFYLLLLFPILSFGQICQQTFNASGFDVTNTSITVNATDLNCYSGNLNSVTISNASLSNANQCNNWYYFELNLDGTVTRVCASDLIGRNISGFTTLSITAHDADGDYDHLDLSLTLQINYTATSAPDCTTLISPLNEAIVSGNGFLSWNLASGATGYKIVLGTTPNGHEILNLVDAGNVTNYYVPGGLQSNITYYARIYPYNLIGTASGCNEYTFSTAVVLSGDFCSNAIDLSTLSSPITDSTVGKSNDNLINCMFMNGFEVANAAPDVYYSILVPNNSTLTIGQTSNEYNSTNTAFYGNCLQQTRLICFDDADTTQLIWENTTGSDQTVYWIQDGKNTESGIFTLEWSLINCTKPQANYELIPQCNTSEFNILVNLTSLGSAASVSVEDDQSADSMVTRTAVGQLTFGPYSIGTPVVISIINKQNSACAIVSESLTVANCPAPNDTCENAIDLGLLTSPLNFTTNGSLNDNLTQCSFNNQEEPNDSPDIFYSIAVPNGSTLIIGQTLNDYNSSNTVFYGDCDNRIQIACFNDDDYTSVRWANTTVTEQIVYWIQDGANGESGEFRLEWSILSCTNPVANFTLIPDCANGDQFLVTVDITSLGTATSLDVSDNFGSEEQETNSTGIVTFGPYPNGTSVTLKVTNSENQACFTNSAMLYNFTPCLPINDTCSTAISATMPYVVSFNGSGSTSSSVIVSCNAQNNNMINDGVWFSFTGNGNDILIDVSNVGTFWNPELGIFTGSCGNFVCEAIVDRNGQNVGETYTVFNTIEGTTYYVNVASSGFLLGGTFTISITDQNLSAPDFDLKNFKVYPNPVKDILNMTYSSEISTIEIYNLIGQLMFSKKINTTDTAIDMSKFQSGNYILKVATDNGTKTFKIIKE